MNAGRLWRIGAVAVVLWALGAGVASAQCSFPSTAPVAFGAYDVLSATPRDSTGSVTFNCSLPVAVTVDLGKGLNSSNFSPRKMARTGGGTSLDYDLYFNSGRTQIWGDGTSGTSHYTGTAPTLQNVTLTIYGRIPAGKNVTAGSYTDTVVATIIF